MPKTATKKENKRLVLLDTHAIIHRAYHALPDFTSATTGEPTGALYGLSTMLMKIVKDLKPEYVVATYDLPGPTTRHHAYEGYKATRKELDTELAAQITRSQDVLKAFGVPIYASPGFEADDILGTIVANLKKDKKTDIIIASGDMDTMQLIDNEKVRVYTLRKGIQDTVLYDEKAVIERYGFTPELIPDFKGLRGDPSDNIIGVPGIGEKTATTLVQQIGGIDEIYKTLKKNPDALKKAGASDRIINLLKEHEEEARFSKMLAEIRTDAPIAFSLPQKTFKDGLNTGALVALFTELGFKSLIPRARELAGEKGKGAEVEEIDATASETSLEAVSSELSEKDQELFKKAAIALWLTNSDITNPDLDDVLRHTKSKTLEEALSKLEKEIQEKKLSFVYEKIELPLTPVLDRMHTHGVLIDRGYLKKLSAEYTKELQKLEKSIYEKAGSEFNINSPKQLGDILFDTLNLAAKNQKRTATGQRSTKESELEKLRDAHPIIEDILAYRELAKLLGTYIDAIPPLLDTEERLHTTFIQTGAATGRMATKNPGLQNIPIKTELGRRIRKAFIAPSGFVLAAFDYSQIELRIAAFLSGDEKLIDIFKRGQDVHAAVAAAVFNVPPEMVDKEMRRRAKVINFGILYGMGVNALKMNLEVGNGGVKIDRSEAQAYLNEYFSNFSGLAKYLEHVKADAARTGYTETLFGRKRYFPGIRSRLPYVRAESERQALNAPMQGTQADIIKLAMVEIDEMLEKQYPGDAHMLLQVHDELIFEIKKDTVQELAPKILNCMESIVPKEKTKGVPVLSSSSVGITWGDMEKFEVK